MKKALLLCGVILSATLSVHAIDRSSVWEEGLLDEDLGCRIPPSSPKAASPTRQTPASASASPSREGPWTPSKENSWAGWMDSLQNSSLKRAVLSSLETEFDKLKSSRGTTSSDIQDLFSFLEQLNSAANEGFASDAFLGLLYDQETSSPEEALVVGCYARSHFPEAQGVSQSPRSPMRQNRIKGLESSVLLIKEEVSKNAEGPAVFIERVRSS